MENEKMVMTEEEESLMSVLLNNQTGYSLSIADALVGQSFEPPFSNNHHILPPPPPQQQQQEVVEIPPLQEVVVRANNAKEVAPTKPDGEQKPPIRFRKAIPPHVLRHLTVHDPKRARRIIANRMSASKAKEKKKDHIFMLEGEVHNLQTEWNETSSQLAFIEDEAEELNNESAQLKERVTMVTERIKLQDELNEQIRKEVQYLKMTINSGGFTNYTNALQNLQRPHNNGTR